MKKSKLVLSLLLVIGCLIPILYTFIVMESFSQSPKIEIRNVVSDDAPLLRVVADYDFSPYSFFDRNNEISGLDVELINEIANRLGMKVQVVFTDWNGCKRLLQNKETELILGLEIFSNLEGVLKTTAVSNDQILVFGKNVINDIAGLKGKRVGLMTQSVIEKIYDLNCEYVPFYTNTQILDAIELGEVDYGLCHGSVAKKIIERAKFENIVPSISLMNSYPAIGVRNDLPELRDKINNILVQMSNEGVIKELDEKWLVKYANKVTVGDVIRNDIKLYLSYLILFFVTIFIAILSLQDSYRKEMIMKHALQYQSSLKKQNDMLNSIANVYFTAHAINLSEGIVQEIHTAPEVEAHLNKIDKAELQMKSVIENTVVAEDLDAALKFTDLTTLAQRMGDKKSILAEFRGKDVGWFCAQFISMDHNESGEVTDVVFTTQSIDEMKKEKEYLLRLSRYDELTHLLNRHAYDSKIKELIENNADKISVIVLDVNSLKATNDKLGHHVGDELIIGAAECVQKIFNDIGTCFRMGGDEFIVIIDDEVENLGDIINNFKICLENWKGTLVDNLSISLGCASFNDIENFTMNNLDELIKLADRRMYEDKDLFYKTRGINRRR